MLDVDDLTVQYGAGRDILAAADRVSLSIPKASTVGLVGESGSGKSTVARAIVGLLPLTTGTIQLEGVDYTSLKARNREAYRRRVQMVFQDPYSSLNPRMTVDAAIFEAVARRPELRSRASRHAEVLRVLSFVGLSASSIDRYPHQFSGGQRQRIAIARALAVGPDLVVLDEVTSALDVSVQATILNLLREIQTELGVSYLFISHDLAVVGRVSDSVAVMYLGRVVERANATDLFAEPKHPYTRALLESIPRFEKTKRRAPVGGDLPDPRHPPEGCRFHTRCPIGPLSLPGRQICIDEDPQEAASRAPHHAACHFASTTAADFDAFLRVRADLLGAGA